MDKKKVSKEQFLEGLSEIFREVGYEVTEVKHASKSKDMDSELAAQDLFNEMNGSGLTTEQLAKEIEVLRVELNDMTTEEIEMAEDLRKFLKFRAPDAHTRLLYDSHGNFVQEKVRVFSEVLGVKKKLQALLQKEMVKKSRHLFVDDFVKAYPKYRTKMINSILNECTNELMVTMGDAKPKTEGKN